MLDYQMASHCGTEYPEWGSSPRKPLIECDMAHQGELMESVIGPHPRTGQPMVYHVLRCAWCIAIHLWPIPSEEDLACYYARTFYEQAKPDMLAHYMADREWWLTCVHAPIIQQALQYLPQEPVRFLDIGAGPGLALDAAEALGCEAWGIEPDPRIAGILDERGHRVFTGVYGQQMDTMLRADYFDTVSIIYLYETLEHHPCPEDLLLRCYALLQPGGVAAVCVPNEYSPGALEACHRFQLPHWWVSAPDHCFMFTPKTLQLLLRRAGFTQRYMRMTFPLIEEFILRQGRCYVGNPELGRQCHHERVAVEMAAMQDGRWPALEAEYIANVAQRKGREIIAIFTKEG